MTKDPSTSSFYQLTADRVIDAVETAMQKEKPGIRATGRALALNSLENRVYEIEFEDNSYVVSKFYRPFRWSAAQIIEEHEFLLHLHGLEIPVVAPRALSESKHSKLQNKAGTLAQSAEGIYFAIFPKVRGRLCDELSTDQLRTLGRYLGRIHSVGKTWNFKHRLRLTSEKWGWESLDYLLESPFMDAAMSSRYEQVAEDLMDVIGDLVDTAPSGSIHGDCHVGNVLWEGDAPFFLDFDDACRGPAAQDIWMMIRGRGEEAEKQRAELLMGYEQMCEWNPNSLSLIEPLRGLRIMHYSAWVARRWDDPSFPRAFPEFGSPSYWRSEIEALMEIADLCSGGGTFQNDE